jgi:hypothetical protein
LFNHSRVTGKDKSQTGQWSKKIKKIIYAKRKKKKEAQNGNAQAEEASKKE